MTQPPVHMNVQLTNPKSWDLFEQHFLPPLQAKGIDGTQGSGRNVLEALDAGLPINITPEQEKEIEENIHVIALCMGAALQAQRLIISDAQVAPIWWQDRLHEQTWDAVKSMLCPLFPFCD